MKQGSAVWWVLLASAAFGTTGTAQALAPDGAGVIAVGLIRIGLGGVLLGLVAFAGGQVRVVTAALRAQAGPRAVAVVSAVAIVAYQVLFFTGARMNGVAVGAVLALGSAPVLAGLFQTVLQRRRPSRRWGIATVLALVGMTGVSGIWSGAAGGVSVLGVLASVGAGAAYATYATGGGLLIQRYGFSGRQSMGTIFGLGGLLGLIALLGLVGTAPAELAWLASGRGSAVAVWLCAVTMAAANLLLGVGLAALPTATVTTLTLAEPLVATVLGVVLLGEPFGVASLVGVALICTGLAVLGMPVRRARVISSVDAERG